MGQTLTVETALEAVFHNFKPVGVNRVKMFFQALEIRQFCRIIVHVEYFSREIMLMLQYRGRYV